MPTIPWEAQNMSRRNEYRQYLGSSLWKEHRNYALDRTSGFCQYCGDVATQVHHVKYPKQFGQEHPHSLIPVCDRCHKISHGIQIMKALPDVEVMNELSPQGIRLNYLLSGGRVYASAKSWGRALQIPESLKVWFEQGLARTAILKKDMAGGSLEMSHQEILVYRWPAVAEILRSFDREWYKTEYKAKPPAERKEIEQFHDNYERLVNWGYDLQERALSSLLNNNPGPKSAVPSPTSLNVTQENLIEAMKQAVAPRLVAHDDKLQEHDVIISEIKSAVPTFRDQDEFITVRQAISEQGLDPTLMPNYPLSKENLSGLTGQKLKEIGALKGPSEVVRVDGHSISTEVNTYRRIDIYSVVAEISSSKQKRLNL